FDGWCYFTLYGCLPALTSCSFVRLVNCRADWQHRPGGGHPGRCPGSGCGRRDAHEICKDVFAYLEHDWAYRYHFCCIQRAPFWFEQLAVDARVAGNSAQSPRYISGAAYYRVTRLARARTSSRYLPDLSFRSEPEESLILIC